MMYGVRAAWHVVLLAAIAGIPGALVVATIYVLLTKRKGMRGQAQGQARSAGQKSFNELGDPTESVWHSKSSHGSFKDTLTSVGLRFGRNVRTLQALNLFGWE